jgi:uncharacterized protein
MDVRIPIDLEQVAHALHLPVSRIEATLALLDAGNTVPFITRYRKDQTGGLDEEQIRAIGQRVAQLRLLAERKQTILRSIESQGKLNDELAARIKTAQTARVLEDLYLPYKPKKQTLGAIARQRGLEPLALEILRQETSATNLDARAADFVNPDQQIHTAAEALLGAGHLIAEWFSEHAELRRRLREIFEQTGVLRSQRAEAAPDLPAAAAKTESARSKERKARHEKLVHLFRDYFDFREGVGKIPPHRVLAINRGERGRVLRVRIEVDEAQCERAAEDILVPADHPHADFLRGCAKDAVRRLVLPSLERELRRELTDRAEDHGVRVFARNLRTLLLQPPLRGRRVLAIDPGFKSGCKIAALDEFGNPCATGVIHVIGKEEQRAASRAKLVEFIREHRISLIAIGNGAACRHAEELISTMLAEEFSGGQRLLGQPTRSGRASHLRRNPARHHFDWSAAARPVERAGQDRTSQHRRGNVSARRQSQASPRDPGSGGGIVRELRGCRAQHGQPRTVTVRFGLESIDGPPGLRVSPTTWPF